MWGTGSVTGVAPEPAEDVFAFLTDVDRLPEWNPRTEPVTPADQPATDIFEPDGNPSATRVRDPAFAR